MITQDELKAVMHYSPETGEFQWLVARGGVRAGDVAGAFDSNGYRQIWINGKNYRGHRLAYLYMNGEMPPQTMDHINGDKTDNRWSNLRSVSKGGNNRNQKLFCTNKTGVVGVFKTRNGKRFAVQIQAQALGKRLHVGTFDSLEDARVARLAASQKYAYHENHGRVE